MATTTFDWLVPNLSTSYAATEPHKRTAMIREELAERAALLCRLGYAREEVIARLVISLDDEYALTPPAPLRDEVGGIVDGVWQRRGMLRQGPPPL